jgi:hypothetical protein
MNLSARAMIITIGFLLITAVMLPNILEMFRNRRQLRFQKGDHLT